MRNMPRWRNLKHFSNVTTVDYTDGQAYLDILKVRIHQLDHFITKLSLYSAFFHVLFSYSLVTVPSSIA